MSAKICKIGEGNVEAGTIGQECLQVGLGVGVGGISQKCWWNWAQEVKSAYRSRQDWS